VGQFKLPPLPGISKFQGLLVLQLFVDPGSRYKIFSGESRAIALHRSVSSNRRSNDQRKDFLLQNADALQECNGVLRSAP
jgi:hypothetical protein